MWLHLAFSRQKFWLLALNFRDDLRNKLTVSLKFNYSLEAHLLLPPDHKGTHILVKFQSKIFRFFKTRNKSTLKERFLFSSFHKMFFLVHGFAG